MSAPDIRNVEVWKPDLAWEERADGSALVWRKDPLGPYPQHLSERIYHWAAECPDRTWMAERGSDGDWIRISYAQLVALIESVAQALLDLGLSNERPAMILSGNSLKHAVLALAAQHVGIPSAAISTSYSLASDDPVKLRGILKQISPGVIFVEQAAPFKNAISAAVPDNVVVVCGEGSVDTHRSLSWSDLTGTTATLDVAAAHAKTSADTVAKFLFTSGTTGSPKAVIQTQRMLCANMQQVLDCFAFMKSQPPIFVDWAPWNHTASGNKVFNLTLYNGGTYYIDNGKPTPKGMAETIRNLREISPTWYFNVPAGYDMLLEAMEQDDLLRDTFFRDVQMLMYAGAGLSDKLWKQLKSMSRQAIGTEILLTTGLGSTETGPFAVYCTDPQENPGNIGIPAQGVVMKLVPTQDKLEARFKGPNITPGYWGDPKTTANAFDDEGFYKIGDAVRYAVPGDPSKGFYFDGRIAENFKLTTGTWVAVGAVRARVNDAMHGLTRDVVIAGAERNELAALLIPFRPAIERLVEGGADMADAELLSHPVLLAEVAKLLEADFANISGSSRRVPRVMFLQEPLEQKRGELTDKGSINQRAVLTNRADMVELLYSDDPRVIIAGRKG